MVGTRKRTRSADETRALIVSEARMANNVTRVNMAAPLASQPKMRSAIGPERADFMEGGLVVTRRCAMATGGSDPWVGESVVDKCRLPE